jgi:hypothetical protein
MRSKCWTPALNSPILSERNDYQALKAYPLRRQVLKQRADERDTPPRRFIRCQPTFRRSSRNWGKERAAHLKHADRRDRKNLRITLRIMGVGFL